MTLRRPLCTVVRVAKGKERAKAKVRWLPGNRGEMYFIFLFSSTDITLARFLHRGLADTLVGIISRAI